MSLKQPWHCGLYVTWEWRWQRAILAQLSSLPLLLLSTPCSAAVEGRKEQCCVGAHREGRTPPALPTAQQNGGIVVAV